MPLPNITNHYRQHQRPPVDATAPLLPHSLGGLGHKWIPIARRACSIHHARASSQLIQPYFYFKSRRLYQDQQKQHWNGQIGTRCRCTAYRTGASKLEGTDAPPFAGECGGEDGIWSAGTFCRCFRAEDLSLVVKRAYRYCFRASLEARGLILE